MANNSSPSFEKDLWDIQSIEYQIFLENGRGVVTYLAVLCIIGCVGNAHVLVIFPRKYSSSNFTVFIVAMAINDILACMFVIPFEILDERYMYTFDNEGVCKAFRFLSYTLTILSGFFLLFIAVERFRKICRPFGTQMSRKSVYITGASLIIAALTLAAPNCVFQNINTKAVTGYPGLTGTNCGAVRTKFSSLYYAILLLISTLVLIVVVVVYGVILRTIWNHRKSLFLTANRESANLSLTEIRFSNCITDAKLPPEKDSVRNERESFASSEDDGPIILTPNSDSRPSSVVELQRVKHPNKLHRAVRNTLMFIVASFISYCGMLPVITLSIIRNADPGTYDNIKRQLGIPLTFLIRGFFINNVVNPYVYCFMDSKFRKECKNLYVGAASAIYGRCKNISNTSK